MMLQEYSTALHGKCFNNQTKVANALNDSTTIYGNSGK